MLDLNKEERAELAAFVNNHDSDSDSGDELDDENLSLFYHRHPRFEWTGGNYVPPAQNDNRPKYSRRSGPVRVLDASITPLEYFNLFYTAQIFRDLVDFANENARRSKESDPDNNKGDWKMLTVDELKVYYGLAIMKDIIKLDRDAHYWHQGGKHFLLYTRFGNVMSRDRFFQIRRYLYFVDPRDPVNAADKLHKIRYILNSVCQNFQDEYVPHEHVTVDEAMVPFKGRLGFKQFMKNKPVKSGIKLWVLADSVTAYCYNLEVYTGKHEQQINRLMGLSAWVVIGLTKPIHNFGHIIYTNNFYTLPILVKYLASRKTYLCGTMHPNHLGYPADMVKTNTEARRLPRGSSDWRQCEDSSMLATAWNDKRMVYYLSTAHAPHEEEPQSVAQRQRDGTEVELPCPPTVAAYAWMASRLDQMTRQNKLKKCMKWYRQVETKLMETCLYNAYIIEGHAIDHKVGNVVKCNFLSFRLDLAQKLVEGHYVEKAPVGRPRTEANDNDPHLDRMDHWPVRGEGKDHVCEVCNALHKHHERRNPGVSYRDNPFKQRKTTMKCEKCSVYLCCNQQDCFRVYHTCVTFVWHVDIEAEDTNAQRLTCIIVYRSRFSFLCF